MSNEEYYLEEYRKCLALLDEAYDLLANPDSPIKNRDEMVMKIRQALFRTSYERQ